MRALVTDSDREAWGVLVAAFQSEREEETRDRAERGSVVRGSDQASVAAKRIPRLDPRKNLSEARRRRENLAVTQRSPGRFSRSRELPSGPIRLPQRLTGSQLL